MSHFNKTTVGCDFDNTIISYDKTFYDLAFKKKIIPSTIKRSKTHIRNYLRNKGYEDEWIELQGEIYGKNILKSKLFPNVLKTLSKLHNLGTKIYVVSHRTLYPFKGKKINLHKSAKSWLDKNQFLNYDKYGLNEKRIFFKKTKDEKINKIINLGCNVFIDDLPEILNLLPNNILKIYFNPTSNQEIYINKKIKKVKNWNQIFDIILNNFQNFR